MLGADPVQLGADRMGPEAAGPADHRALGRCCAGGGELAARLVVVVDADLGPTGEDEVGGGHVEVGGRGAERVRPPGPLGEAHRLVQRVEEERPERRQAELGVGLLEEAQR